MPQRDLAVVLPAALDGAEVYVDDVGGGKTALAHLLASDPSVALAQFSLTVGSDCPTVQSMNFTYVTVTRDGFQPYREDGVRIYNGAIQIRIGVPLDPSRAEHGFIDTQLRPVRPVGPPAAARPRTGVPRVEGRTLVDDAGPFYPRGGILMNAIYWWHQDLDHLKHQLDWYARKRADHVRVLSEVDWTRYGPVSVDPRVPWYDEAFVGMMTLAYEQFGMRIGWDVFAGADLAWNHSLADYVNHTHRFCDLIAPHLDKIVSVSAVNEADVTLDELATGGMDLIVLEQVCRILAARCPVALLSATSDVPGAHSDRSGPQNVALTIPWGMRGATVQLPRTNADNGLYQIGVTPQQWKDAAYPQNHDEDSGPGASSYGETDAVRMATQAAMARLCGATAFVIMNGAGISGVATPASAGHPPVPANVDEMTNIDAVTDGIMNLDRFLPARGGDGGRYVDMKQPNAFVDVAGCYVGLMVVADESWAVLVGVGSAATLTAHLACEIDAYDILTGGPTHIVLGAGGKADVTPLTRDNFGAGAMALRVTFIDPIPVLPPKPTTEAEWKAFFDQTRAPYAKPTPDVLAAINPTLMQWGGTGLQHNNVGALRGRWYYDVGYEHLVDVVHYVGDVMVSWTWEHYR